MKPLNQLTTYLKSAWERFTKWIALWPDVWAELLAIGVFLLSAPIFGFIANKFGGVESGILANLIITALEISFINALVFLGILLNFKVIFDWYKKKPTFTKDWFNLTAWQRFSIFMWLYSSLFLAGVILIASLQ